MTQQREPEAEQGPVNAPEFTGGEWLQGGPVPVRGSGKVVLVDFWDYTCVNCLRTLPYLTEWHRRYAEHGLVIVGVHTPEFSFARNPEHVKRAIAHLALDYPVVLDAEFAIWQAYANRYWPAKYFVDINGKIVARHYGEGGYAESERLIQMLLAQQPGFDAVLPEVMEPVRPEDSAGAVCYRVTPELYCGYSRGLIGNIGNVQVDQATEFTDPGKHLEGTLYLEGAWMLQRESASRPFGARGVSRMHLDFMAADVNLVMHPPLTGGPAQVRVLLDGAEPGELAGEDVRGGAVTVDVPRMYALVRSDEVERRSLTLETSSDGVSAFAFTFTSCVAPPPADSRGTP
ncbi:MAG: redoxin domain-containing protein [Dehalococcoidia bacterium]|nr:redoxin domain-containing protein [Dehalococcoidia bacterium]